jgi:hypothetical protein
MQIHPGSSPDFTNQQDDFNFNQFGDGVLRKRVITGKENGVELIPSEASSEGMLHLAKLTLRHAQEQDANMRLEEEFGVNNTPATLEEVAEAMGFIDGASVLDPNNRFAPIAVIAAN